METAYRNEQASASSLYTDADAQYATMKQALTSEDFQNKTEPEVQRWLAVEQQELVRRMLQAFATLRGQAQAKEPVIGSDGTTHTQQRDGERKLETMFGTVEVGRSGYTGEGRPTL
jgi:hypothetical protein